MRRGDIIQFLRLLRAGNIDTSGSDWVQASCPLAVRTHQKGEDRRPSFGIKVNDKGESCYNCFVCGHGSLQGLMHRITWLIGYNPQASDWLSLKEIFVDEDRTPEFTEIYSQPVQKEAPRQVPNLILQNYPVIQEKDDNQTAQYLQGRGIDLGVAHAYRVRRDSRNDGLIFCIRDVDMKVYLMHFRSIKEKIFYYLTPTVLGYQGLRWGRQDFWYGIEFVDFSQPVILVESETDVLRLRTLGVGNVMASCGPIGEDKLSRLSASRYLLGFDADDQGNHYAKVVAEHVHSSAVVDFLDWAVVGKNDAGDLDSREEWDAVLLNAIRIGVKGGEKQSIEYPEKFSIRR
jgi:5S rRNA maturation endonuclease (ribonuclease M5)